MSVFVMTILIKRPAIPNNKKSVKSTHCPKTLILNVSHIIITLLRRIN